MWDQNRENGWTLSSIAQTEPARNLDERQNTGKKTVEREEYL